MQEIGHFTKITSLSFKCSLLCLFEWVNKHLLLNKYEPRIVVKKQKTLCLQLKLAVARIQFPDTLYFSTVQRPKKGSRKHLQLHNVTRY